MLQLPHGDKYRSIKSKFGNMEVKKAFDLSQRLVICIEIKSLTHLLFFLKLTKPNYVFFKKIIMLFDLIVSHFSLEEQT